MYSGDDKFAVEDVGAGTIGVCGYLNAGTADEVEAILFAGHSVNPYGNSGSNNGTGKILYHDEGTIPFAEVKYVEFRHGGVGGFAYAEDAGSTAAD